MNYAASLLVLVAAALPAPADGCASCRAVNAFQTIQTFQASTVLVPTIQVQAIAIPVVQTIVQQQIVPVIQQQVIEQRIIRKQIIQEEVVQQRVIREKVKIQARTRVRVRTCCR